MRILHTADWHLGKTLEGRDRQSEQIQVMDEICQIAEAEAIDLVLIAGDIYQTVNPPAWAEQLFYETIHRLSHHGKRAVVVISGNHDQPERIKAANPLADKQGIYLVGLPNDQLHKSLFKNNGQVHTVNAGLGWLEIVLPTAEESAFISVLPYPSEARLRQLFVDSEDIREIRKAYSSYIWKWFNAQKSFISKNTVKLAMSHLFVKGGEASESEVEIQLGGAYTVDPAHFPDFYQYVALGHLHRAQNVKGTKAFTRYSGSPLAYSFSEANHKKSVTIVDVKPNSTAEWTEIPLTSGKKLIQKSIVEGGIPALERWIESDGNNPIWIDLVLHAPYPLSIEEIQRIRKMHDGFINIRVVTPKLDHMEKRISLSEKKPTELFTMFYQHRAGATPKQEVVDLFQELFYDLNEGEEN